MINNQHSKRRENKYFESKTRYQLKGLFYQLILRLIGKATLLVASCTFPYLLPRHFVLLISFFRVILIFVYVHTCLSMQCIFLWLHYKVKNAVRYFLQVKCAKMHFIIFVPLYTNIKYVIHWIIVGRTFGRFNDYFLHPPFISVHQRMTPLAAPLNGYVCYVYG